MAVLNTSRQNGLILVILLLAQLFLMSGSVRGSAGSTRLESLAMRIGSPVVVVAESVGGFFQSSISGARDLITARSHNRELESELNRLRREVAVQREAMSENVRLRQLLEMREDLAPRSIGAVVVTSSLTPQTKLILVDRGLRDGVKVDQPVITWGGAVGRVVAVEQSHAKIRLLNDTNSGVAGIVQRSRAQGMVQGRGDSLDLLYVPRFSDVALGDRVVTSGLDGIFPRGFGVGLVHSVVENPDGTQTIRLIPEVDFDAIEEVLILIEPVGGELLERAMEPEDS